MISNLAPPSWESEPAMPFTHVFLIFVVIPLATAAVIALLASARSIAGGDRDSSAAVTGSDEWFGRQPLGRGTSHAELTAGDGAEDRSDTGGASARW